MLKLMLPMLLTDCVKQSCEECNLLRFVPAEWELGAEPLTEQSSDIMACPFGFIEN